MTGGHYYVGQLNADGQATGEGVLHYEWGGVYEGSFLDNKRHGLGIWTWADGTVVIGWFEENNSMGKRTIYL